LVGTPAVAVGRTSAWAQYTIRTERRDELAKHLAAVGIPTAIYYPRCLHEQPAYANGAGARSSLPNASSLARTVLSLPMHPYLEQSSQDRIAEAISEFCT
ncbi:MAG: DegT/DnrJ/EryC1/StrS family aminotransferase, partial [Acidimicrobiales bacterium]